MNSNDHRRVHSHAIEIKRDSFLSTGQHRATEFENMIRISIRLDFQVADTRNEMNSRAQWGSFSAVNIKWIPSFSTESKCRDELPHPNGVLSISNQKFTRTWKRRCRLVFLAVDMNSRVQWDLFSHACSIPSPEWTPASNGVHCRVRSPTAQPSSAYVNLHPQCKKRWISASNGVHSRTTIHATTKSKNSQHVYKWPEKLSSHELPCPMGFILVHQYKFKVHRVIFTRRRRNQLYHSFGISLSEKASQPGIEISKHRALMRWIPAPNGVHSQAMDNSCERKMWSLFEVDEFNMW